MVHARSTYIVVDLCELELERVQRLLRLALRLLVLDLVSAVRKVTVKKSYLTGEKLMPKTERS